MVETTLKCEICTNETDNSYAHKDFTDDVICLECAEKINEEWHLAMTDCE